MPTSPKSIHNSASAASRQASGSGKRSNSRSITGLVTYAQDGQQHWLTVFGGFAEVGPGHVTILARVSETVDMIDLARAEAARLRALQSLKEAKTETDLDRAQVALNASLIRLQAASRPGGHGL